MGNPRRLLVKSTRKRKRRSLAEQAVNARWKKDSSPPTIQLPEKKFTGSRVLDLNLLSKGIEDLSNHGTKCKGKCSINKEVVREGLASVLEVTCDSCSTKSYIQSSTQIAGSGEIKARYSVNAGAVWGQMVTGGGHQPLSEILASVNVPCMTKITYEKIENQIGQSWGKLLLEETTAAGQEEKRLAIERRDTFQGVPAITVIVDGGWAKRSHKHSYNAKSGAALIIGKVTKKLLYIGVRNKYCSICAVADNRGIPPQKHTCYKNWTGSSCAMETDILVCGFNAAERMHGVRYMRLVGDGDSSVLANIQQYVPIWGPMVTKVECANHSIKCYRNRLEKIVTDFPKYKGKGGLTQRAMKRLACGARCAIKMHSQTNDIEKLRSDLRNGPHHVFNNHSHCNPSFCKVAAAVTEKNELRLAADENSENSENPSISSTIDNIIEEEIEEEVHMHNEEDEAREGDATVEHPDIPEDLLFRIVRAGDRLVSMAPQLISNTTSNLAECFMNIRCKFDGGKYYNRIQRGSFQHRTYGAGLRFQLGPDWSSKVWPKATGSDAGEIAKASGEKQVREHQQTMRRKSTAKYQEQRKKAK